jgi:hypothetical protein
MGYIKGIWEGKVTAYFEILFQNSAGRTEIPTKAHIEIRIQYLQNKNPAVTLLRSGVPLHVLPQLFSSVTKYKTCFENRHG